MAPLVLGFISALALVVLLYNLLKREGLDQRPLAVTLGAVIFVMPLPYLVLDGMEPALHTALTVWFLYLAGVIICAKEKPRGAEVALALLAPLMVAARFEGLFLLMLTAGLLALRRRYLYALLLIALGALPVLMLGIPSMLHGGWILPNSVMLKGHRPSGTLIASVIHLARTAISNLGESKALMLIAALAVMASALTVDRSNFWRPPIVWLMLFLGMLAAHLAFAQIGNPFRYEAYLIVSGIFVLALCLHEAWAAWLVRKLKNFRMRSPALATMLLLVLSLPLMQRGFDGLFRAAGASRNCFEQQYQTARFVQRYYAGQSLVLNDIGYVGYLNDIRLTDLAGLGSNEILRQRAWLYPDKLEAIARAADAKVAIIYPTWLTGVPNGWIKVAEWQLKDKPYALGGLVIDFYATNASEAKLLKANLETFDPELPREVVARIESSAPPLVRASSR